jgi:hypothetical protein
VSENVQLRDQFDSEFFAQLYQFNDFVFCRVKFVPIKFRVIFEREGSPKFDNGVIEFVKRRDANRLLDSRRVRFREPAEVNPAEAERRTVFDFRFGNEEARRFQRVAERFRELLERFERIADSGGVGRGDNERSGGRFALFGDFGGGRVGGDGGVGDREDFGRVRRLEEVGVRRDRLGARGGKGFPPTPGARNSVAYRLCAEGRSEP